MKKAIALLLAGVMAFACVGCAGGSSSGTSTDSGSSASNAAANSAASGDPKVEELLSEYPRDPADEYFGISLPLTSSEYYKGVESELSKYCEEFGIAYSVAVADSDSQRQVSQIENFITMGCTTVIVYSIDLEATASVMQEAREAGIRVVSATMTPSNPDSYDISVDASQEAVGTAAAQYAADWIEENYPDAEDGSVEVVLFTMSISDNAIERCDAFYQVEAFSSKARIVDVYDIPMENYLVKCQENAELMLQEHPDVKVIITYSDTFNIIIDEVMMASPDIDPSQVCSVAVDKTTGVMEKIKLSQTNESMIRATIATGEDFNRTLIEAALGAFDEQLNDLKQYFVEPFVINADNVDRYL